VEKTRHNLPNNLSCLQCRFCDQVTNLVQQRTVNICRLNPPSVHAMPGLDQQTRQVGWMQTTLWPEIAAADWCGEFEARLAS